MTTEAKMSSTRPRLKQRRGTDGSANLQSDDSLAVEMLKITCLLRQRMAKEKTST
jgi:hypothetical protein